MTHRLLLLAPIALLAACEPAATPDTAPDTAPAPTELAAPAAPVAGAGVTATTGADGTTTATAEATTTLSGTVTGDAMAEHPVTVSAGSGLTVALDAPATTYFNVVRPGGEATAPAFVGAEAADGSRWTDPAPVPGTYRVMVYQRGAAKDGGKATPYRLTVTTRAQAPA